MALPKKDPMHLCLTSPVLLALMLPACGSATPDVANPTDVPAVIDVPLATDASAPIDAALEADAGNLPTLHGCRPDLYVDQTEGTASARMIMTRGTTNTFDFPCMTIRAGQSVQFMWAFSRHPLAPGLAPGEAGTAPDTTPIVPFSTGSVHTIRFPTPGFYPFYCSVHPGTMKGVVQVL